MNFNTFIPSLENQPNDIYLIKLFYNVGPLYLTCFSANQETCNATKLDKRLDVNEEECKQFCNQNSKCNFVFHTVAKHCLIYEICDEKRTTNNVGTTYGKSTCPGELFLV